MKITITNNRPSGGLNVYAVDGVQVAPGEQHAMVGRTASELIFQMSVMDDYVSVIGELEGEDRSPLICQMKDVADPAGDATESDQEGFDILDEVGAATTNQSPMYIGVFDDADCSVPSAVATLAAAGTPVGTIQSGSGTNQMKVTPAAAGTFECKVVIPAAATVATTYYIKAWPQATSTSYVIDSSCTESVTFTPA